MHLMVQQDGPDDYVIATGEQHSVREFVELALAEAGATLEFSGEGADEVGRIVAVDEAVLQAACGADSAAECDGGSGAPVFAPGSVVVRIDPRYFRPTEVETLLGDATKAQRQLDWRPTIRFPELVREMMREDLAQARRDGVLRAGGFEVREPRE